MHLLAVFSGNGEYDQFRLLMHEIFQDRLMPLMHQYDDILSDRVKEILKLLQHMWCDDMHVEFYDT